MFDYINYQTITFLIQIVMVFMVIGIGVKKVIIDRDFVKRIAFRYSIKNKSDYKLTIGIMNDVFCNYFILAGHVILLILAYITYQDFGIKYVILIPVIYVMSIKLGGVIFQSKQYENERLAETLERMLEKQKSWKQELNINLGELNFICEYLIDKFENEELLVDQLGDKEASGDNNAKGFDKMKNHLERLFSNLSAGFGWIILVVVIGFISIALRNTMSSESRKTVSDGDKLLKQMDEMIKNNKEKNQLSK